MSVVVEKCGTQDLAYARKEFFERAGFSNVTVLEDSTANKNEPDGPGDISNGDSIFDSPRVPFVVVAIRR